MRGDHDNNLTIQIFSINGVNQATSEELDRLFSGRSAEKEPTKKWFAAQLELYGIPYKKSALRADLKNLLEGAFKAGKVSDID